jgi:glutathione S-transferase
MITLHHLRIGRPIFTVWLLEELGLEYQMEVYRRHPETMRAPDSLKQVHPLGKSPVIEDDGLVLTESGAIAAYLLEKHDSENKFGPNRSDLASWAEFTQWLAYPEGSVFAPLLLKMFTFRSGIDHPVITPFSDAEIKLHYDHIANKLGDNDFILGDQFSAADFGISYVVSMGERLGQLGNHPSLAAYWERMQARPAFTRAVEKAVE